MFLRSSEKKKFTFFVCGEEGITNPLKTHAQGGGDTFALKRFNAENRLSTSSSLVQQQG